MQTKPKPQLLLFNTESRELERIIPQDHQSIRIYTCGPTIYDFAHIGNFRTYVFEDLLRRALQFFGYSVIQAMNITDIDDKTIRKAIEKKCPLKECTDPFRIAFFEDLETLHIERVEYYPAATDYIPDMIHLIENLIAKGSAYRSQNGSIYFKIKSFSSYGRLSHLHLDELKANASGDNEADEYDKENIARWIDFLGKPLWPWPAGLAYRVFGHGDEIARGDHRYPLRRRRQYVSAPRKRDCAIGEFFGTSLCAPLGPCRASRCGSQKNVEEFAQLLHLARPVKTRL
jgi:cysteinyl-tRNA synthetase